MLYLLSVGTCRTSNCSNNEYIPTQVACCQSNGHQLNIKTDETAMRWFGIITSIMDMQTCP